MMTAVASYRDQVPPLPADVVRPKWSVMIPSFNCARYLGKTLESVLIQDQGRGRMQIEVVDDCSHDNPERIVRQLGGDRVGFFRQKSNVGHIANFQTCLMRSQGEIVHLLHGDDLVRPGFYDALQAGFDENPPIGAAFCRSIYIDGSGQELSTGPEEQSNRGLLNNALVRLAREQRVMTPSIAVRRSAYEQLGGFDKRLKCSEDWEMWVRIAAHFPIWYEPRPLALYRIHGASNTGRHAHDAKDIAFTRVAIKIFEAYLPDPVARDVTKIARSTYARTALSNAKRFLEAGENRSFWMQVKEGMRLEPSPRIILRVMKLLLKHFFPLIR